MVQGGLGRDRMAPGGCSKRFDLCSKAELAMALPDLISVHRSSIDLYGHGLAQAEHCGTEGHALSILLFLTVHTILTLFLLKI